MYKGDSNDIVCQNPGVYGSYQCDSIRDKDYKGLEYLSDRSYHTQKIASSSPEQPTSFLPVESDTNVHFPNRAVEKWKNKYMLSYFEYLATARIIEEEESKSLGIRAHARRCWSVL